MATPIDLAELVCALDFAVDKAFAVDPPLASHGTGELHLVARPKRLNSLELEPAAFVETALRETSVPTWS